MGLTQQIVLLMFAVLVGVLTGTVGVNIHHARLYLNQQLGAHAQDTATAMAVSLSAHMDDRAGSDAAVAESLADAIAESGFYRLVRVENADGSIAAQREIPVRVEDVPAWFMRLVPLDTPVREAPLQAGWRQAGRVLVGSHPGYAYKRLWLDSHSALAWFLAMTLLAALMAALLIRYALKPLRSMEAQAASIGEGRFAVNQEMPRTPDLRHIARALNHLSGKVESMLSAKVEVIKKLEQEASRDAVTGLLNRAHFDSRLGLTLRGGQGGARSALFIVRLTGLFEYNARHGYDAGNELLASVAKSLSAVAERFDAGLVGRLGGAELGLFLPAVEEEHIYEIAPELLRGLQRPAAGGLGSPIQSAHLGVGVEQVPSGAGGGSLLARADMALRGAESRGAFAWSASIAHPVLPEAVMGSGAWRDVLRGALHARSLHLFSQAVVSCSDRIVMHREVSGSVEGPGRRLIPGEVYLPLAQRLRLAPPLDRLLIELSMACQDSDARPSLAFRLANATLHDMDIRAWVVKVLREQPDWADRVSLEFGESAAAAAPHLVSEWVERLRPYGVRFGLYGVGREARLLDVIKTLPLDYLKLDPMFSVELERLWPEHAYASSVVELAHDLDRMVIATGVDTVTRMERVIELGFDAMQGEIVAPAVPLPAPAVT